MDNLPTIQFTDEQKAIAENCIKAIAEKDINMPPEFFAKQVLQNIKAKGVRVTADDVLTVFKVASDMGLDPSSKDIFAFKSANIPLTVGIGFRGWSRACEKKGILGVDYEPLKYTTDDKGNEIMERLKVTITKSNGGKVSYIINRSQAMTNSDVWRKESDHMLQIRGYCRCASLAFGWGAYEIDEAKAFYNSAPKEREIVEVKEEVEEVKAIPILNDEDFIQELKTAKNVVELRRIFAGGTPQQMKNKEIIAMCQELATKFENGEN